MTDAMLGQPPVLVLVAVQNMVNLASCIRVAKNFGIDTVRLVQPECEIDFYRIEGVAHNTADVLDRMTIHDTLDDAFADLTQVHGLTGRERTAKRRVLRPRVAAAELVAASGSGRVGILAGREDHGLWNEELDRCDSLVTISANPAYTSLNLAQAVAVYSYEVWVARGGDDLPIKPPRHQSDPASHALLEATFASWEAALGAIDFLKTRQAPLVMRSVREIVYRAQPDAREAALLRAIGLEVVHYMRRTGRPLAELPATDLPGAEIHSPAEEPSDGSSRVAEAK
ncbi:MAG TPA: TrmH family RNA methyltransferase [Gemmatimonadales bacterium]|jgi:TrmH family RNA methyltransferase